MINMEPLGHLRPDDAVPEWMVSDPTDVGYFPGTRIKFVLENLAEDGKPEEFVDAVRRFLRLTPADREYASPYVFKNYTDFIGAVGPEDVSLRIATPGDVWKSVQPTEIRVSRRSRRDKMVYVQVTAECEWEPEHGLQIVYRGGHELCRVSHQDGHLTHADAYDLPEEEDRIV